MQPGIRCELVTWGQVHRLARDLALQIREDGFAPDLLVAIGRGGWVPGRLLSDYLGNLNLTGFKVEHYRGTHKQTLARVRYPLAAEVTGQRVLLVDDVTDTGDSIEAALAHIRARGRPLELRTAVLHHKTASSFEPDYFVRKLIKWRWIIYPWALMEDLAALVESMNRPPGDAQALALRLRRDHGIRVQEAIVRDLLTFTSSE